jgi:hypothetical protein
LEDTLSPAAGVHLVYLFMSLCAKFNLTKHLQNDLTKAFPQTQLEPGRTIYLIPPPGSEDAKLGLLWRADKNMYGRKPGPRCLNVDMNLTLSSLGYVATRISPSILFKKTVTAFILCLVHLDDTRWAGREEDSESMECDLGVWEKKYNSNRVSISRYLGLDIDMRLEGILVSQNVYVRAKVDSWGLQDVAKDVLCPMLKGTRIEKFEEDQPGADKIKYLKDLGEVGYAVLTRPEFKWWQSIT